MSSSISTSDRKRRVRAPFVGVALLSTLIGAGLGSLVSAFGSTDIAPQLIFAATGRAEVVLFGNSMNRTRSHCDDDLRDLAAMLEDELAALAVPGERAMKVRDISSGGMRSAEHVAQARLLVARRAVKVLIVPAIPGSIEDVSASDQRDRTRVLGYLLLAMAQPLELLAALRGSTASVQPSAASEAIRDPQRFGARRDALMQAEKNAEVCPEQPAINREFMRYMYRTKVASLPREVVLPEALRSLAREAAAANIQLLLYAPPFATEVLKREGMQRELKHQETYATSLARAASALPLRLLDLHDALSADAFTDAWCACGHLRQTGRASVARALALAINER